MYHIQIDRIQTHIIQMHKKQIHMILRYITKEYNTWYTIQNIMRKIQSIEDN